MSRRLAGIYAAGSTFLALIAIVVTGSMFGFLTPPEPVAASGETVAAVGQTVHVAPGVPVGARRPGSDADRSPERRGSLGGLTARCAPEARGLAAGRKQIRCCILSHSVSTRILGLER